MNALTVLKEVGPPGSLGFLALACAIGLFLIYVWPRRKTLGRAWLISVYLAYIILGWPVLANAIAGSLSTFQPVPNLTRLGTVDLLIVLGGDNGVGRIREAVRAWHSLAPREILVFGELWLVERLAEAGVPPTHIRRDPTSPPTTRDQIVAAARLLGEHPGLRAAIVASRLQMPRVAALAHSAGIDPLLLPSPIDIEPPTSGTWVLVPSYAGLRVSRDALYEHAALFYYESRGWIGRGH